jgi:hypothetical protein
MPTYDNSSDNIHVVFVSELATMAIKFQDSVNICYEKVTLIENILESLCSIPYTKTEFILAIDSIQKLVDFLNFEGFSHLEDWITFLNSRIEEALLNRLNRALDVFVCLIKGVEF